MDITTRACSKLLLVLGTITILGLAGVVFLSYVRTVGLCCWDDASFAVLAKNLAEGRGYTVPFRYAESRDFTPRPFDALIGLGPVSVIPVAVAIKLFGPQYWVPGATHVVLELLLLALVTYLLSRAFSTPRVLLFLVGSLVVILLTSARNLNFWSAQLGETIAALLVLCAYLTWATRERSIGAFALAGVLLGLAVLTKELVAIYVATFVGVVVVERLKERSAAPLGQADIKMFLALAICGVAPFAIFELCRLWTLGLRGFYVNWLEHLSFMRRQSAAPGSWNRLFELVAERAHLSQREFYVGVPTALALGAFSVYLTRSASCGVVRRAVKVLAYGLTLHALYWLVLSPGWPRYLYTAVVLWCFLATLPLLAITSWRSCLPYFSALAISLAVALPNVTLFPTVRAAITGTAPLPNQPEREVAAYLDHNAGSDRVYTSWWGHIVGAQYFAVHPARFQGDALGHHHRAARPFYVVLDQRLLHLFQMEMDVATVASVARCGPPVFISGSYQVFYCTPAVRH